MTQYVTTADALFFHKQLIERYGGAPGIRDAGALESALHRPQTGYYDTIIHPDDMARILEYRRRWPTVKDGEVILREYRMRNPKGEWRSLQSHEILSNRHPGRGCGCGIRRQGVRRTERPKRGAGNRNGRKCASL